MQWRAYIVKLLCEMRSGGDVAFNKEVLQQLIHNDWTIIDSKRPWQCSLCSESHLTAMQCTVANKV